MGNKQNKMNKIKQALISVSDKTKLKLLLKELKKNRIKIISSGGTFKEIKKLGYNCKEISKFTNSSEIFICAAISFLRKRSLFSHSSKLKSFNLIKY